MRMLGILGALLLLATSLACALFERRPARNELPFEGPGAMFYFIEDAALDAMAYAYSQRYRGGRRPQLLAGAIQQVNGGFSYTPPIASTGDPMLIKPSLRHQLGPDAVASYLIYNRTRSFRANQELDRPWASMRRIVDELDPEHRPLFVLTPSLDVLVYDGTDTRSLARLGAPRSQMLAETDP